MSLVYAPSLRHHTCHTGHIHFSLQDSLRLRQKLISSAMFSSFSVPLPVSQLTMPASHFHRPHSTGLGLFRLLLFTLCFGSWMSRLTPGGHSFLLTRKILSFERLGTSNSAIQRCSGNKGTFLCHSVHSYNLRAQHVPGHL